MLKLTFIIFSILFVYGECNMTKAVSNSESSKTAEQRIKQHAQKHFAISPEKINLAEAKSDSEISGVREFYLSQEGRSSGGDYTYFLYKNNLYCSGIDEDFSRFLKDYEFLKKDELDKQWFMYVLKKLNNYQNQMIITEKDLNNSTADLKPFLEKISVPEYVKTENDGVKFTFFTQTPMTLPVRKHEVTVSPDYKVDFKVNFVEP